MGTALGFVHSLQTKSGLVLEAVGQPTCSRKGWLLGAPAELIDSFRDKLQLQGTFWAQLALPCWGLEILKSFQRCGSPSAPLCGPSGTLHSLSVACGLSSRLVPPVTLLLFSPGCPSGTFKANQGDEACTHCPINSRTTSEGATNCVCRNGYYRADLDPVDMPCTSTSRAPGGDARPSPSPPAGTLRGWGGCPAR